MGRFGNLSLTMMKIYHNLARLCGAYGRCVKENNPYAEKHRESIKSIVKGHFPSGSGFDKGTVFDLNESSGEKLVFHTSFHHMNEGGFYDGWTEHSVIVMPSLEMGFRLRVTGRDKNQIKDYIAEMFSE